MHTAKYINIVVLNKGYSLCINPMFLICLYMKKKCLRTPLLFILVPVQGGLDHVNHACACHTLIYTHSHLGADHSEDPFSTVARKSSAGVFLNCVSFIKTGKQPPSKHTHTHTPTQNNNKELVGENMQC